MASDDLEDDDDEGIFGDDADDDDDGDDDDDDDDDEGLVDTLAAVFVVLVVCEPTDSSGESWVLSLMCVALSPSLLLFSFCLSVHPSTLPNPCRTQAGRQTDRQTD